MKLVAALGVLLVCVGSANAWVWGRRSRRTPPPPTRTPPPPPPASATDFGIGCIHRLDVTQDVALESGTTNHNSLQYLLVGKHPQYPNKRSLLQFENLNAIVCGRSKIIWAKMYVFYVYAHKASWHTNQQTPYRSRPIQVYQVNKPWNEAQATSTRRTTGNNWSQTYLSLSGSNPDAGPGAIDTVTVHTARPRGFIEFDVTSAVRNWASGRVNNGVLLRAVNENDEGRGIRFSSNADSDSSRHAYINVLCQC